MNDETDRLLFKKRSDALRLMIQNKCNNSMKRKLSADETNVADLSPPQKKSKSNEDQQCENQQHVYLVFSCKEYCVDEYDNRQYPDYGETVCHGVFDNVFEANQCAIHHFKRLEIKRIKNDDSYEDKEEEFDEEKIRAKIHKQCEKYTNKEYKKCFNKKGDWSEEQVMDRENDGSYRISVWVSKRTLKSEFTTKK